MAAQKQPILTKKEYQQMAKANEPKRPVISNCVRAFLVGGTICLIGQVLRHFRLFLWIHRKSAGNPTAATLIFLSVL